jgi:hypothetical protein
MGFIVLVLVLGCSQNVSIKQMRGGGANNRKLLRALFVMGQSPITNNE